MKQILAVAFVSCAVLCSSTAAWGVTVTVDPSETWLGYMNWFELPSNGGGYVNGGVWGTPDLVATFSGPVLTLAPNSINDPSPYWYTPSGGPGATGNKIMDANMYVQKDGSLAGQTVTFTGQVLSNTLASSHSSVAFIKDFAPDFSSFGIVTAPLTPGVFSISLPTVNDPARHVQYGFETKGPDVWITDVAQYGNIQVTAVPEPTSVALFALSAAAAFTAVRRRASA